MTTKLLYLEDMYKLQCNAHIIQIINENGLNEIIVDQTVFYPQGGGQPSDIGTIKNDHAVFDVKRVSIKDEIVVHEGDFSKGNSFNRGSSVELEVNEHIRSLHNKYHTAGHLIDYALHNLGYNLISSKAYHFPQGPYVEYHGTLEQLEREQLQSKLEKEVNTLIDQALPVKITLIDNDPKKRAMIANNYQPILCGGTHIPNTKHISHITIRKIKNEKGNLRVSYGVI